MGGHLGLAVHNFGDEHILYWALVAYAIYVDSGTQSGVGRRGAVGCEL